MEIYIYLAQTIIGIFLWKKLKFSWNDSIIYSLMLLPNILLVSIIAVELFMSKLSFVREKLYGRKHGLEKLEENSIKCTGNNDNGCFMENCSINCNCEGLEEFGETLKNKLCK